MLLIYFAFPAPETAIKQRENIALANDNGGLGLNAMHFTGIEAFRGRRIYNSVKRNSCF